MGEPALTARIGGVSDVATLNPMRCADPASAMVIDQLYEHLLVPGPSGLPTPGGLVEAWSADPDTDAVDFTLRPGVRFHDGSELTADDVEYSLRTALEVASGSPCHPPLALAATTLSFEVIDRHRLRVWLAHRSSSWRTALAGAPILPRPRRLRESASHHLLTAIPPGTGPFELLDRTPGRRVTLRANSRYHAGRPALDRVDFLALDSAEDAVTRLLVGGVDCVPEAPAGIAHAVAGQPGVRVRWNDTDSTCCLVFNLDDALLRDRRVRRAFAHAVDRQGLVQRALDGAAVITETVAPRGVDWHTRALVPNEYDVAKAASLLDDAGWRHDGSGAWRNSRDGRTLRITILTHAGDRAKTLTAECIATDLRQVGVETTVTECGPRELWYERLQPRDYQAAVVSVETGRDPISLRNLYHSAMASPAGGNLSAFHHPRVDELLELSLAPGSEPRSRREWLDTVQRIVVAEVPHLTLYSPRTATLFGERFLLPEVAARGNDHPLRSIARWRPTS